MNKSTFFLLVAVAAIGWFLMDHFDIKSLADLGLTYSPVTSRSSATPGDTLTIASFNLEGLDQDTLENPPVMNILVRIIRRFDVIAIQGLPANQPSLVQQLVDQINETGRQFHCLLGPPVGRDDAQQQQFAFLFDESTIEIDHQQSYTIKDPDDLLARPPLVAWFRAKEPAPDQAFTFSLVNVDTDPHQTRDEIKTLDDVFLSVRDDGRNEDDVILLGSFRVNAEQLAEVGQLSRMTAAITAGTPTDTAQTIPCDNLLFQQPATAEYLGRGGVFDFLRQHNLTLEQALLVSAHLPVWGEFSVVERGDGTTLAGSSEVVNLR